MCSAARGNARGARRDALGLTGFAARDQNRPAFNASAYIPERTIMRITKLLLPLLVLVASAAYAHHSTANFDKNKQQTITGTVKFFGFVNPHSFFDIDVTDASGKTELYKVFAPGKVLLMRYGWKPGDMKSGDTVTVLGNPDRDDHHFMYLLKVKFASGKDWERSQNIPE